MSQWRIWAAIATAAIAWGTTGVATRAALADGVPPVAMVAYRAMIAVAVLYAVLRLRGLRISRDRSSWSLGVIAGVFQLSVPFVLFTLAYQYASAGFVGILVAMVPLATATIANFMLPDEPLHGPKVVGLLVAFGGVVYLLASGDSGLEAGSAARPLMAAALSLGAVLSIGFSGVVAKSRAGSYDPMELTWMQFAVGVVLIGITMIIAEGVPFSFTAWGWFLIAYLAVIGSVVPFLAYYWLLGHVTATKASLVGYVVPLVALASGIVLLDERLQAGILVGGGLILVGVILTDRSERRQAAPVP